MTTSLSTRPGSAVLPRNLAARLLVFVLVVLTGLSTVYRAALSTSLHSDFSVYMAAGHAVVSGQDIYTVQNEHGWNYVYPPPFSLLLAPWSALPPVLGAALWYLLELLALLACAWMSMAMAGPDWHERDRKRLFWFPVLMILILVLASISRCQTSIFMDAFIIGAFFADARGRQTGAGISLALAALLKVFPGVLIVYFIFRRRWQALMSFVATLLLLGMLLPAALLGWQANLHNLSRWVEVVGRPALMSNSNRATATPLYAQLMNTLKPRNQSLESLELEAGIPPDDALPVDAGVGLVMLGVMWMLSRRPLSAAGTLALASAFVCWALLIPPISEAHYFGALLMPLACLVASALRSARPRLGLGVLFSLMCATMLIMRFPLLEAGLRPLCIATLLLWLGCVVITLRAGVRGCLVAPAQRL